MEKKIRYGSLFVFYGKLLTEKQYDMLNQYYLDDFSLAEIAENSGISRQAVYDAVKKSNKALDDCEKKLGFYNKFERIAVNSNRILQKAEELLSRAENGTSEEELKDIVNLALTIIEENNR